MVLSNRKPCAALPAGDIRAIFEARPLDGAPEKINGKVETQLDMIRVIIQRFTAVEVGTN